MNKKQQKECRLYLYFVSVNGHLLKQIPVSERTKELCDIAVENDPSAIEYVPAALKHEFHQRQIS